MHSFIQFYLSHPLHSCPRGVGAATWKQIGSSLTKADCMRRCDADIHCNAIEILGCRDNPQCLGDCYHFYGTSDGAIHNECTNDLAQYPGSAYRKLQGGVRARVNRMPPPRPSFVNQRRLMANRRRLALNRRRLALDRWRLALDRQQLMANRRRLAIDLQQ